MTDGSPAHEAWRLDVSRAIEVPQMCLLSRFADLLVAIISELLTNRELCIAKCVLNLFLVERAVDGSNPEFSGRCEPRDHKTELARLFKGKSRPPEDLQLCRR